MGSQNQSSTAVSSAFVTSSGAYTKGPQVSGNRKLGFLTPASVPVQNQRMATLKAVSIPLTESDLVIQGDKANKKSRVEFNDFRNKLQGKATTAEQQQSLLQRVMSHAMNGGDELYMVDQIHITKIQSAPKPFYTLRQNKTMIADQKVYNLPHVIPTVAMFESI